MATKTIGASGMLRAVDWQDTVYNLSSDARLDLVQIYSHDTINFIGGHDGAEGPYNGTFNLTSLGGTTIINANAYGAWSGSIHIYNGQLTTFGGTHSHWTNTGDSVIAGNSFVNIHTMTATGGTMDLSYGGKLEWVGAMHSAVPVTLDGGTLISDPFTTPTSNAGSAANVTFHSQSYAHMDEVDLRGAFNAASWSMKDDLLQVFNAQGGVLTSIANFHNLTGQPIQVDQTAAGVAVIASSIAREGMLVAHA